MTTSDVENFYNQDTKNYELVRNKEFFNWLKNSITDGYKCFIGIKELQDLIDKIVQFYVDKYKDSIINSLDKDNEELFNSLTVRQQDLLNAIYRSGVYVQTYNFENGQFKRIEYIYLKINKKNERYPFSNEMVSFQLCVDFNTGQILNNTAKGYVDKEGISLEELLEIFIEKYEEELDFTELEECVYNNYSDIELRHRVLELAALKILFHKSFTPEVNYEIAKNFINDFNERLGLTLSTDKLDIFFKNHVNVK